MALGFPRFCGSAKALFIILCMGGLELLLREAALGHAPQERVSNARLAYTKQRITRERLGGSTVFVTDGAGPRQDGRFSFCPRQLSFSERQSMVSVTGSHAFVRTGVECIPSMSEALRSVCNTVDTGHGGPCR